MKFTRRKRDRPLLLLAILLSLTVSCGACGCEDSAGKAEENRFAGLEENSIAETQEAIGEPDEITGGGQVIERWYYRDAVDPETGSKATAEVVFKYGFVKEVNFIRDQDSP